MDKIIISLSVLKSITQPILWSNPGLFVSMIGQAIDTVGIYFILRWSIEELEDYDLIIKTFILTGIPIAIFMIIEHLTGGRNFFSIFGGVPEYDLIREGRFRAQGAFSHPIMAGTFGALLYPIALGIKQRGNNFLFIIGIICARVITFMSSSSGPIITLGAGMFGVYFFKYKKYTKKVRNLFFLTLVILHLIMQAPVWHLIARISLVGGSTGDHRYRLIDAAIHNFSSWALLGIKETSGWGVNLIDITNQYILEGAESGIIGLILFILIIVKGFQSITISLKTFEGNLEKQKYIWSLGVILFAHTVTFIAVSYFGQVVHFYYIHLAMISNLIFFSSEK